MSSAQQAPPTGSSDKPMSSGRRMMTKTPLIAYMLSIWFLIYNTDSLRQFRNMVTDNNNNERGESNNTSNMFQGLFHFGKQETQHQDIKEEDDDNDDDNVTTTSSLLRGGNNNNDSQFAAATENASSSSSPVQGIDRYESIFLLNLEIDNNNNTDATDSAVNQQQQQHEEEQENNNASHALVVANATTVETVHGHHQKKSNHSNSGTSSTETNITAAATVATAATAPTNTNTTKSHKTIPYGKHKKVPPPEARLGPNGEPGYVHDPTAVRKLDLPISLSLNNISQDWVCGPFASNTSAEGKEGYQALTRISKHLRNKAIPNLAKRPQVKLFCSVYTYDKKTDYSDAIRETWGKRCDGLYFASTITNLTTSHIHTPHISRAEGKYDGMWQKVRSMMAYIYDNFLDDYDYFHFNGDDTYLIVENLKEFLTSAEVQKYEREGNLLFSGFWMPHNSEPGNFYYLGGGSGYTMSKHALKALVELGGCMAQADNSMEDVNTARCFRKLNVTGYDTRDAAGAHRYHQLNAYRHAVFPDRSFGFSTKLIKKCLQWQEKTFGHKMVLKQDYISSSSISFHKLYRPDWLRRYDHILYGTAKEQCQDYYQSLNHNNGMATSFVNVTTS